MMSVVNSPVTLSAIKVRHKTIPHRTSSSSFSRSFTRMAEIDSLINYKASTAGRSVTTYQPPTRRRVSLFRRRKLPTVRLGAGGKNRRGFFLVRIFRRVRLKALKLKYLLMLKKLTQYYRSLTRDMIEGSSSADPVQKKLILETSLAVLAR